MPTRPTEHPRMPPIRVAVVDDSALLRGILGESINRQPDMVCVGTARDALAARELLRAQPDVITLDAGMARMDGIEFLSRLMRLRPTAVVMLSCAAAPGPEVVLKALAMGALDVVARPLHCRNDGVRALADSVIEAVRRAARARIRSAPPSVPATPRAPAAAPALGPAAAGKVVLIGAGAGGTEATREVLSVLPADTPPVLVSQRLPAGFTATYAARLRAACHLQVSQAEDGTRLRPGHAYVAPGGRPMWLEPGAGQPVLRVGPLADEASRERLLEPLFASAARVLGADAIGIVLSGDGRDGAAGLRAMRDAGAWTLAQNEASCVAGGMTQAAVACGAVQELLPLQQIAPRLLEQLRRPRVSPAAGTSPAGR
jgi:two-component system chemotaxis response regulator CheB